MKAFNTALKKRLEGRLGSLMVMVAMVMVVTFIFSPYVALKIVGAALMVGMIVITITEFVQISKRDNVRDVAGQTHIDEEMASTARAKQVLLRNKEEKAAECDEEDMEAYLYRIPDDWR